MNTIPRKRTIVIQGLKTSLSLEDDFWDGFREIAKHKKITASELVEIINQDHNQNNLSSAIRVYVFKDYCMWLQNLETTSLG